jgi:formiminotetrahydrofolate cyclodeaminase
MAFRDQTIDAFMQELSSKAPVPGGGGASALVGALSASLTHMVGSLTVGKPKYVAVEAEMNELLKQTEALVNRFLALMDEDAEAFEPLAQAYRLPKETEEEKASKAIQMEAALKSAVQPPLAIMETCEQALPLIAFCAEKGSVVAVSDAGVAASLCRAALEGASLNVLINTQGMQDKAYAEMLNIRARELLSRAGTRAEEIFRAVYKKLDA